jgi:hypothetical protein
VVYWFTWFSSKCTSTKLISEIDQLIDFDQLINFRIYIIELKPSPLFFVICG